MPTIEVATFMELSDSVKEMQGASTLVNIPLELKLLIALVALFLVLLILIMVLWDRYGKEIGELYTSPMGTIARRQNTNDVKVHDVADEFSIYQKLPTFFYEYVPRRKTTTQNKDKLRECKT
ncbi:unnamed protein product [Peronospora farinosa]|uniref:Uncharacterized protein n=1 Tax=Peronospora farinosa TaxID=134698 RepID=A0AAV0UL68_9STRA|nr:unnamed protein product [Peronospora farinosa]CAI5736264.1 unnamed protein product [Peronospora farinosa]